MDDYNVFLNHRGPDVKAGFIAHLEEALRQAGLNPFLDKKCLVKGNPAFGGIDAALEVARVHVAVVSRGYAESKYSLCELVAMLKSKKPVIPVFYDVEPWELRRVEKGQFAAAFEKHRSQERAERVEEWVDALGKLADITGFCFRLADYEGDEVELKQKVVDAVLRFVPAYGGALQADSHYVGLEDHVRTCVKELKKMGNGTSFLCLVGMGGIGKTSLAKGIYNHMIIHGKFRAMSFLEIGRSSHTSLEVGANLMKQLQKQLLWDLLRVPEGNQRQSYEYWFGKMSRLGPVLVVLDDIQDKGQFDKLICKTSVLACGSCIIATSRDQHLLKLIVGKCNGLFYEVTPMGHEDSEKLFNWHAFGDEEAPKRFMALANEVSKACGGLPLALKVVGSSLFGKTSDEDLRCMWPEAIEALRGDQDMKNALRWSYDQLSESEKLMFVDIACVFCGWMKEEAMEIWQSCKKCLSSCGHGTPHTSLQHLIDKSLVILNEVNGVNNVLTMHGLLRDMGQAIGEVEGSHLWKGKAMKVVKEQSENASKVRALNLANTEGHIYDAEDFARIQNLHMLVLDGCDVRGNFGSISKELRYLRWRDMPLVHGPPMFGLSNLVALDFSESSKLMSIWIESGTTLEGCPNLLTLDLRDCTSITTLPDSIGRLSSLQELNLNRCKELQKLPNSIGQLTALKVLRMGSCGSLEALPDSICGLPRLQRLYVEECSSLLNLPAMFGFMRSVIDLNINLVTEWQVVAFGQLNALKTVLVTGCTDEVIALFDTLGTFSNMQQLVRFRFYFCPSMSKVPETVGLLTNLEHLSLWHCEEVRELPNSIGQLKVLRILHLRYNINLETLPDSLGALSNLQDLSIVNCTAIRELPTSIGHLSSLENLHMWSCSALQSIPHSISQLNALKRLEIVDCGGSLEGLGLWRALQGLRIWGCTSITKLQGPCLVVVDTNFTSPTWIVDGEQMFWVQRDVKEVRVVEENDCGFLRHVRDSKSGQIILQRVFKSSCCEVAPIQESSSLDNASSSNNQNYSITMSSKKEVGKEGDKSVESLFYSGFASDIGGGHGTHYVLWLCMQYILCCNIDRPSPRRSSNHE